MIDPQTILALSQEIIGALGLDDSARDNIIEELSSCSAERLIEMIQSLQHYHEKVVVISNRVSGQIIHDGNTAQEIEERVEFDRSFSLI